MLPDHRNIEPRFGFAYRPFHDAKTVVRGGYGIYAGQIPAYIGVRQISWSNTPFFLRETFEAAAGNALYADARQSLPHRRRASLGEPELDSCESPNTQRQVPAVESDLHLLRSPAHLPCSPQAF
jgi:hypothetical protein